MRIIRCFYTLQIEGILSKCTRAEDVAGCPIGDSFSKRWLACEHGIGLDNPGWLQLPKTFAEHGIAFMIATSLVCQGHTLQPPQMKCM